MGPKWLNFETICKSWLCPHLKGCIIGVLWARNFFTLPQTFDKIKNSDRSIFRVELRLILLCWMCLTVLLSGLVSQFPQRDSTTSSRDRDMTFSVTSLGLTWPSTTLFSQSTSGEDTVWAREPSLQVVFELDLSCFVILKFEVSRGVFPLLNLSWKPCSDTPESLSLLLSLENDNNKNEVLI